MPIILGTVTPPNESPQMPGGYVILLRFQATASGIISLIKFKPGRNGTVKVAVYADSSGAPGALLNAVNTATAVNAGTEASIPISGTPVTGGLYYWLAFAIDSGQSYYYTGSSSGTRRYKAIAYSDYSFPDPAGGGHTGDSYDGYIAGESEETLKTASDSGAGSEYSILVSKEITVTDSGAGANAGSITVYKESGDGGAGSEAVGLQKSLGGDDFGRGRDSLKTLLQKAGSDLKLSGYRGRLEIPDKEVNL